MFGLRSRILALAFSTAALAAGCAGIPAYRSVKTAPHKDVAGVTVYLDDRADAEVYQKIALDEAARVRSEEAPSGLPLYEVRVEFLRKGAEPARLALVIVLLGGDGGGAAVARAGGARMETIVY